MEQYRLITAEKVLLEKTLSGTIRMLMEILALVDPEMFGWAQTLRLNMRALAAALLSQGVIEEEELWPLELAALLSRVGAVTVPSFVVGKVRQGTALNEAEQKMWMRVPEISHKLLRNIPRLEPVAQIVRYQHKHFDGSDAPAGSVCGEMIPRGARMLKVLLDFMELETGAMSRTAAFALMQRQSKRYDPAILAAARRCFADDTPAPPKAASVPTSLHSLCAGQVLAEDVRTADGTVLLAAGRRLSDVLLEKLRNHAALSAVAEPLYVECV